MKDTTFSVFIILSSILLQACLSLGQHKESQAPEEPPISRRDLVRKAYRSDTYYVIFADHDPVTSKQLLEVLSKHVENADRLNIKIIPESQVKPNLLNTAPILFVGAHTKLNCLNTFKNKMPLQFESNHFTFEEKIYKNTDDVFLLSYYPNPTNKSLPISIITSNTTAALLSFLNQKQELFNYGRWGFEHYQGNKRRLMGNFNDQKIDWPVNQNSVFTFDEVEILNSKIEGIILKQNAKLVDQTTLETIYTDLQQTQLHFKQLFNVDSLADIKYEIFKDGEQKGLITGNTNAAHIANNTAYVAVSADQQGNLNHPEVNLYANQILGISPFPLINKGLPLFFSENWQKKGYLHWYALLAKSKNEFKIEEILSENGIKDPSEIVRQTVGAAFCHFVIEEKGIDYFKKVYSGNILKSETKELEENWASWQQDLTVQTESFKPIPKDFYWKGFNFTHEGYQVYNGYISKQAEASLDRLMSLGSNSVTLVPYSYMRDPNKPTPLPIPQNAGSENDASIIHTIHHAHKKGLKVLLKPQVWVGRNSWPGDIEMKSEKDWETFFGNYYRWIRHYALMAAIYDVEALCLGVEFSRATLKHPKEWRKIITEIRKIYKGPITYSANWGEEFEKLTFWDALDYIGISCYYPLTKTESPSDRELIKGFEKTLGKIEKIAKANDKTVLLTEIGFRSISAPWMQPHDYPGEQDASEEGQNRCYKIVFGCLNNEPWCKGMFWWKWPTTFDKSNTSDKRFTPYNKAAENTVKKWYSRK